MGFHRILGQERIIQTLKKTIRSNKTAHAYLIEGNEGLGKKTLALEIAKALVCTGEDKPCDQCNSCKKVDHGNYAEIKILQDTGTIKVDDVRELIKDMQLRPYEGTRKVYIICDVDRMNIQGQNAILKTLEEPPSYVTIILLSTKANSLLPTIISRCQIIKLNPVSLYKMEDYLISNKNVDPGKAKISATFSNGSIGKALEFLDHPEFLARREMVISLCNELFTSKLINILEKVQFFEQEKPYVEQVFDLMINWYRDLYIYTETKDVSLILNSDKMDELDFNVGRIDSVKLRDIIFIIENAKNNLKSNVQFHLNLEVMLLNIQEVLSRW